MAELGIPEAASTFFTYFNPTKSPYYTVGVAACVALFFTCDVQSSKLWLWLSVPAFLVAALAFLLSLDAKNLLTPAEHAEQLRFARSTSISFAVLSLSFAGRGVAQDSNNGKLDLRHLHNFYIIVVVCCVQISLFLLYNWAMNKEESSLADHNYVQITLLTSAFLVDICGNLATGTDMDNVSLHHLYTGYVLGAYWAACTLFWLLSLKKLGIKIAFTRPKGSQSAQPTVPSPGAPNDAQLPDSPGPI